MSHKSKPRDGSGNNGTKGGGLYGHHLSGDPLDQPRFFRTILRLFQRRQRT